MESYSRFTKCIFKGVAILLEIVGHNFLNPFYRRNPRTYFVYTMTAIAILSEINGILYHDLSTKIFCSICLLFCIQVIHNGNLPILQEKTEFESL